MHRTSLYLIALLYLTPAVCIAAPAQTPPRQYAKFILSEADMSRMSDAEDIDCRRHNARVHNLQPGLLRCIQAQIGRLEVGVRFAYASALGRLLMQNQASLQRDQSNWSLHGLDNCIHDWEVRTGARHQTSDLQFHGCKATELYRRMLWLEHQR